MHEGKVAIVTGAGSGVGRATAQLLAAAGWGVVLVGRRPEPLEETRRQILASGAPDTPAQVVAADISRPESATQVVARTLARFARIDTLANVAGYVSSLPIEHTTPDQWRQTIDTNLSAVVFMTAAVWPTFRHQHAGVIVNVSSMASIDPFPGLALYAAAKVGVNLFTRCTAREGEPIGVKAVAVAPGAVETGMLRSIIDAKTLPRDRTLAPEQVGAVIRDCITGARPFASGETILLPSP
jgi:NAD(P)-dependent dehydrogenase (short-subunit alcohol dehydrogenase family)